MRARLRLRPLDFMVNLLYERVADRTSIEALALDLLAHLILKVNRAYTREDLLLLLDHFMKSLKKRRGALYEVADLCMRWRLYYRFMSSRKEMLHKLQEVVRHWCSMWSELYESWQGRREQVLDQSIKLISTLESYQVKLPIRDMHRDEEVLINIVPICSKRSYSVSPFRIAIDPSLENPHMTTLSHVASLSMEINGEKKGDLIMPMRKDIIKAIDQLEDTIWRSLRKIVLEDFGYLRARGFRVNGPRKLIRVLLHKVTIDMACKLMAEDMVRGRECEDPLKRSIERLMEMDPHVLWFLAKGVLFRKE
ncbi:MAG: hypothetical protein DRN15_04465 [Thermoprotei archaeon]|nr:MAG: hypothetical protein DRN15_04465 [Thermoprotei archaeon]RLF25719.1 MAG: hypothetical protein DRM97_00915 [Thermoprotei archaeon]